MQRINASVEPSTVLLTELWTDSRPNSGDPRRHDGLGLRHIAQEVQLNGRIGGGATRDYCRMHGRLLLLFF